MTNNYSDFKGLVNEIRIEHLQYSCIYDALANALEDIDTSAVPVCLHIVGDTRTGKSCVVRDFLSDHKRSSSKRVNQTSVVYAIAPPKATVKGVLSQLLKGLGDPYWSKGTLASMEGRLHLLLEKVSCRMIVIDEFQHLCDKGQRKALYLTSDFLKTLIEDKSWGLIAVGLPSSTAVITTNPQLAGRFDATLTMPVFDWRDTGFRKQFKGLLAAFQKQLKPFHLPDLSEDMNAFRMCMASAGRVGLVAKILDRAVKSAIRKKTHRIPLEDLQLAFDTSVWFAPDFPVANGPFNADMTLHKNDVTVGSVLELAAKELYEDNSEAVEVVTDDATPETETKKKIEKNVRAAL